MSWSKRKDEDFVKGVRVLYRGWGVEVREEGCKPMPPQSQWPGYLAWLPTPSASILSPFHFNPSLRSFSLSLSLSPSLALPHFSTPSDTRTAGWSIVTLSRVSLFFLFIPFLRILPASLQPPERFYRLKTEAFKSLDSHPVRWNEGEEAVETSSGKRANVPNHPLKVFRMQLIMHQAKAIINAFPFSFSSFFLPFHAHEFHLFFGLLAASFFFNLAVLRIFYVISFVPFLCALFLIVRLPFYGTNRFLINPWVWGKSILCGIYWKTRNIKGVGPNFFLNWLWE